MIRLVRVDHRLVHGQVAFSWTKFLDADCILIASDELVKDELRMSVMKMATPSGVKLVMKSIEDSAKALNSGVTDKYRLFILCESVKAVYELTKKTDCIKFINLGGMKNEDGRRQISKAVYVSEDDILMLRTLNTKGIKVHAQLVPDDQETDVMKLI